MGKCFSWEGFSGVCNSDRTMEIACFVFFNYYNNTKNVRACSHAPSFRCIVYRRLPCRISSIKFSPIFCKYMNQCWYSSLGSIMHWGFIEIILSIRISTTFTKNLNNSCVSWQASSVKWSVTIPSCKWSKGLQVDKLMLWYGYIQITNKTHQKL